MNFYWKTINSYIMLNYISNGIIIKLVVWDPYIFKQRIRLMLINHQTTTIMYISFFQWIKTSQYYLNKVEYSEVMYKIYSFWSPADNKVSHKIILVLVLEATQKLDTLKQVWCLETYYIFFNYLIFVYISNKANMSINAFSL